MRVMEEKKEKYIKPQFVIIGNGKDIILGYTGVNTEWTSVGSTKPCAGCTS